MKQAIFGEATIEPGGVLSLKETTKITDLKTL